LFCQDLLERVKAAQERATRAETALRLKEDEDRTRNAAANTAATTAAAAESALGIPILSVKKSSM
jgi:hypothetical protein